MENGATSSDASLNDQKDQASNVYLSERREELIRTYRDSLLNDIMPFWIKHGLDPVEGGIWTALGLRGEVLDTDKSVWFQGRSAWTFATMFNVVEPRQEWLDAALSCGKFLRDRCADSSSGKLYFTVTSDGDPLRMRRYVYSECFAAIGFAALQRATGDVAWGKLSQEAYATFLQFNQEPGLIPAKVSPETRPMKGLAPLMITLVTAQDMRADLGEITVRGRTMSEWAAWAIEEIIRDFVKPDVRAVMEVVGPAGEIYDHFDGRLLNPGHAIEASWFILREAKLKQRDDWRKVALDMLRWMWNRGWDREHGGLLYFADVHGKPVQEYWHDMKFWWPHNEAIIATLMATIETGDSEFAEMHRQVHDWTFEHFPDPVHGEWFGYLNRSGRPTNELKGSMWKGPFHLPRQLLVCWKMLEEVADAK